MQWPCWKQRLSSWICPHPIIHETDRKWQRKGTSEKSREVRNLQIDIHASLLHTCTAPWIQYPHTYCTDTTGRHSSRYEHVHLSTCTFVSVMHWPSACEHVFFRGLSPVTMIASYSHTPKDILYGAMVHYIWIQQRYTHRTTNPMSTW